MILRRALVRLTDGQACSNALSIASDERAFRRRQMPHPSATLPRLLACAILGLVAADPTRAAAQTECEAKRRSCISECHARFFSIDPRRNACIADCMAEAARCARGQPEQQGTLPTLRPSVSDARMLGRGFGEVDALTPPCTKTIREG
ncbi:hypothetical protein EXY23_19285 [Roseicella aquatilis]|uniref:Uncharacterized protein n=1 Tax=Roseicella aquatilis TaxID=2527868 RepID=A0A4R4D8I4_9PROT|nr:hypothetical protein EXY23_19285 [Roseicella aquatilis]